ncbi:MAG: hypothetical protein QXT14_08135 [Candidatus Bathyarchaeia archaeon]
MVSVAGLKRRGRPSKHKWKVSDEQTLEMLRSNCPGGYHSHYVVCPVCLHTKHVSLVPKLSDVKLENIGYVFIKAKHRIDERALGGTCGFFECPAESKTLEEASSDPSLSDLIEIVKSRILDALDFFIKNEIVLLEDLEKIGLRKIKKK